MRKWINFPVSAALSLAVACALVFTCTSCSQDDITDTIQDGAEAATVAGMLAIEVDPATAAFAPIITAGLPDVCQGALDILNDVTSTATLQSVLNLAYSQDPNLAKYKAIINFCLPILEDIPGVQTALNESVSKIPADVNQDVQAFFTGILTGLGDAPGTTVAQLMAKNPRLQKAAKKLGVGKFDPTNLINSLKAAAKK